VCTLIIAIFRQLTSGKKKCQTNKQFLQTRSESDIILKEGIWTRCFGENFIKHFLTKKSGDENQMIDTAFLKE